MNNQSQTLAHFGIFGMRWGVRRFQNEDGTLTEEGRRRYLIGKDSKGNSTFGERSFQMYNEVADRANRDLGRINKKYGDLSKDDAKNLQYTKELRDIWQNHFKDVLAKDIGTDRSSIEGQKWLKDVFGYDLFDEDVKDLEKKVKAQEKKDQQKNSKDTAPISSKQNSKPGKVNMNPKPLKDYSGSKMSQKSAINTAYSDLEKIYPNFNDLPLDTQDMLFFNYLNSSGLENWV